MGNAWVESVQKKSELTVFRDSSASQFAPILTTAIMRFNSLSGQLGLNVRYSETTQPPSETNLDGANVRFSAANGVFKFKAMDQNFMGSLAADAAMGITAHVPIQDATSKIQKAFIFLPANLKQNDFMKICMTVHELVHAAGLHNSDHSDEGDWDVFCSILVPAGEGVQCGLFANRIMPPIWMTNRTARKIQSLWP